MSTFRNPVGPQPSKVYWRRRLAVLVGVLAIILIVVLILVKPGSGKPTASNTHTPPASTAPAKPCATKNIEVDAHTDALSYAPGVDPMLSLTIVNNGAKPCTFAVGTNVQTYVITSGSEQIWSSKDCQTGAVAVSDTLEPGKVVKSTPFAWDRTRSNPSNCSVKNPPQVIAKGASYHLAVTVNGVTSTTANSPQFVLR